MWLKDLEWSIRQRFVHARRAPFTGEVVSAPAPALVLPAEPKLLFLRHRAIGDTLVSIPVLRAIRRHYPSARVHVMLAKRNFGVRAAVLPWADRLWRYDQSPKDLLRLILAFRRERYDVIVDLRDTPSATSLLIVRWSRARQSLGFCGPAATVFTHCVSSPDRSRVHVVERLARLLLPFNIDPKAESLDLDYPITEEEAAMARRRLRPTDRPLRLGVNISGQGHFKYWGRENFTTLVRWIGERYPQLEITVCGEPAYAEEVVAIASAGGVASLESLPSFHEFAAVIHEFDVLVTPDTSILHLAAAWKIPTVALFRPEDPDIMPWLPYRTPCRALSHPETIAQIPLGAVREAIDSLLAECFPAIDRISTR